MEVCLLGYHGHPADYGGRLYRGRGGRIDPRLHKSHIRNVAFGVVTVNVVEEYKTHIEARLHQHWSCMIDRGPVASTHQLPALRPRGLSVFFPPYLSAPGFPVPFLRWQVWPAPLWIGIWAVSAESTTCDGKRY